MDVKLKSLKQQLLKLDHDKNFKYEDFYVSPSNQHIFDLLNKWPKWDKNLLNISGENYSGKTHLINIFLKNLVLNLRPILLKMNILMKLKIIKILYLKI